MNNIHDKVFTCPKCQNRTLYPVEVDDVTRLLGIGYHDLCICDECGAELLAEPQFDNTVKRWRKNKCTWTMSWTKPIRRSFWQEQIQRMLYLTVYSVEGQSQSQEVILVRVRTLFV